MRVVLRVVAWIWIVFNGLGAVGSFLLTLAGGEPVKAFILLAGVVLVLPGVLVLLLTKPKASQG